MTPSMDNGLPAASGARGDIAAVATDQRDSLRMSFAKAGAECSGGLCGPAACKDGIPIHAPPAPKALETGWPVGASRTFRTSLPGFGPLRRGLRCNAGPAPHRGPGNTA
jgi:tagatose-1,6-bisphosphate aldolase